MSLERRQDRISKELQQVVSRFLLLKMKGLLPGLVTVQRVKVSRDLRSARIFVTHLDFDGSGDDVLDILESHRQDMQKFVACEMPSRFTPVLSFEMDQTLNRRMEFEKELLSL